MSETSSYKLSIIINRGACHTPASENLPRLKRLRDAFQEAVDPNRYTYVRVTKPDGKSRTYYYDNSSKRVYFAIPMLTYALTQSTLIMLNTLAFTIPALASFASPLLPVFVAGSPGKLRRMTREATGHVSVDVTVDEKTYHELEKKLRAIAMKKTHGYYSPFFNNCSGFASRTLRDHGVPVPRRLVMTPSRLADFLGSGPIKFTNYTRV